MTTGSEAVIVGRETVTVGSMIVIPPFAEVDVDFALADLLPLADLVAVEVLPALPPLPALAEVLAVAVECALVLPALPPLPALPDAEAAALKVIVEAPSATTVTVVDPLPEHFSTKPFTR